MMSKNNMLLHAGWLTLACFASSASTAQEMCKNAEGDCGHPRGFYVGAEYGAASTDFDYALVESLRAEVELDVNSVTIDDSGSSLGFFVGYQFNKYLAVEVGHRDVGQYWVNLTGEDTDGERFDRLGSNIYPESGHGVSAGAVISYPITDAVKVAGKFGMWAWDGVNRYRSDRSAGELNSDDTTPYYGMEASYQINGNWQTYISAMQYQFKRDTSSNFSLGIRYFLGSDSQSDATPAATAAISSPALDKQPLEKSEALLTAAAIDIAIDIDGDGVYDAADECANTPSQHLVDARGCTVYQDIVYPYQLTINYDNNSSLIDASYVDNIQELADFANEHKIKYMLLVGHTSAVGEENYNQWLSERRAKSLQRVLIERHGYSAAQIDILGKGETELLDTANSEAAHQKNRRVEVNLSTTGKQPKLR